MNDEVASDRPIAPVLPGLAAVVGVAAVLGVVAAQMAQLTPGHLAYAVDDSHIHLRLAQMIAHGTYGVNPGTAASPSSSALWPFLLAPFGRTPFLDWMPLVLNAACALVATFLGYRAICLGWMVRRPRIVAWVAAALSALLMLASGCLALVFEGMEHSLQVMLTVALVLGVLELARDRSARGVWWLWVAIAGLPLVRYEGLLISAVGVVIAVLLGAARPALRAAAVAVGALGAFSLFLLALGLPVVPSSVLAKGKAADVSAMAYVADNIGQTARATGHVLVPFLSSVLSLLLSLTLVAVLRRQALRSPAALLSIGSFLLVTAQITLAQPQRRYVGFVVLLTMLVAVAATLPTLWRSAPKVIAGAATLAVGVVVFFGAVNYLGVLRAAPVKAQGMYDQQYQLHRIVEEYLQEPVAVNDLGHVAFDADQRIVDLWGLGDNEARRRRTAGEPGWLPGFMEERDVEVAMIYPSWFGSEVPDSWILVGTLENPKFQGGAAEDSVALYAVDESAAGRLRDALERFEPSDPERTVIVVAPE